MLLDDVLIQGTTGANIPVLGNLPVPQMRGAQFSVNMKFNLDGVDYEYEKTSANVDLLRNRRQTLIINLFDADAWNYITEVRQFPL